MKVSIFPQSPSKSNSTLILGGFGGFHYGHTSLIDAAKKLKRPITLLMVSEIKSLPKNKGLAYATLETRLQQAANYGVDQVIVLEFNETIRNMPGAKFLEEIIKAAHSEQIVVGRDFSLGFNRDTDSKKITELYPNTLVLDTLKFNDKKLSTEVLRELVETGSVEAIKKLSPFSYTAAVRVDHNKNFEFETIAPQTGVYAAWTVVNEIKYWSLVLVGQKQNSLYIPDLRIMNEGFDASIEFRKMIRVIVKEGQSVISDLDKESVIKYLGQNK